MVTVQRVRVRWGPASRGAARANARRGLDRPVFLPDPLPPGEVVAHEVLFDEANGYRPRDEVLADSERDPGVRLMLRDGPLIVSRSAGGCVAYPRRRMPASRLFTLAPGEVGRYRANFRLLVTTCPCNPNWYYESWTVHISNGPVDPARFRYGPVDHDVDHRISLYGPSRRR
ncbi:hypothetical protein Aca07nite_76700 [Actinoplanes capillaceus]|uniref:Uncharacterized protein n=1 Tax=Actinoplanes campanulatus TaxID=113559 RepID=A0ABQ3WVR7_9ACTN|nr:hypothetical protein [Actinoplanes capillaceus]GID50395.1 hypothetical protein Aca07nite_76700 [Actinoplanes capillaceus]